MTRSLVYDSAASFLAQPERKLVRSPAGIRRLERNVRRLRLYVFQLIYKVTGPWHAPRCFATHVETGSPPTLGSLNDPKKADQR